MLNVSTSLPGYRVLFWMPQLFLCHLVTWRKDRFVPSGLGFVIHGSIVSVVNAFPLVAVLIWPNGARYGQLKFKGSHIDSEIGFIFLVQCFTFWIMLPIFAVFLILRRSQVAATLNLLNRLWMR